MAAKRKRAPRKTPRRAKLEAELVKIEDALDEARLSQDPSRVETQMQIAGLTANYWMLQRRLAAIEAGEITGATQKQTAARKAAKHREIDCDRRHNEAQTQFARLSSKLQADLLPKVLARLQEIDADESALQEAARRRMVEGR